MYIFAIQDSIVDNSNMTIKQLYLCSIDIIKSYLKVKTTILYCLDLIQIV